MTAKTSSTSTILIVLLLIITFPLWIGIAGGLFGLMVGLAGACVGIIAGVFGAIIGAIGAVIGGVFGIFDWVSFPHFFGFKFLLFIAIVFTAVMISRSRKKN